MFATINNIVLCQHISRWFLVDINFICKLYSINKFGTMQYNVRPYQTYHSQSILMLKIKHQKSQTL